MGRKREKPLGWPAQTEVGSAHGNRTRLFDFALLRKKRSKTLQIKAKIVLY
jgi:hypothetical protein